MRRYDLLDEYATVASPFTTAPTRAQRRPEVSRRRPALAFFLALCGLVPKTF